MFISVIVPTYNRFYLVNQAIHSVLQQTYKNYEIIVVDDCSADDGYEQLASRTDINYYRLPKRSGLPAVVRNFGIRKAKGDWIAFLDDDDYWLPNKLEVQIQLGESYKFVCSNAYCNGRLWIRENTLNAVREHTPTTTRLLTYDVIEKHNQIINSSVLIKKEVLEGIGLIPEGAELRGREDYEAWLKILHAGNLCLFIEEGLLDYSILNPKYHTDDYICDGL